MNLLLYPEDYNLFYFQIYFFKGMDIWEVFTGTKRRMIGPSLAMFAKLILESVGIFVHRSPTTKARTSKF